MIRVLIVEDSATMRGHLREALAADPQLEVVGEAVDGLRAVEMTARLRPDVITMDMMLPGISGLAATEQIMAEHPTPILVVSSADRQELFSTYNALAAGAVDVLEKPRGDDSDADWSQRLRATLRMVSRIRVITHPRARLDGRLDRRGWVDPVPVVAPPPPVTETLGVARSVADPDNVEAEFAVIIRSDLKGQGLGTLLLERVIQHARSRSTGRLVGLVLRENTRMMRLCAALGLKADPAEPAASGLRRMVLELRDPLYLPRPQA